MATRGVAICRMTVNIANKKLLDLIGSYFFTIRSVTLTVPASNDNT